MKKIGLLRLKQEISALLITSLLITTLGPEVTRALAAASSSGNSGIPFGQRIPLFAPAPATTLNALASLKTFLLDISNPVISHILVQAPNLANLQTFRFNNPNDLEALGPLAFALNRKHLPDLERINELPIEKQEELGREFLQTYQILVPHIEEFVRGKLNGMITNHHSLADWEAFQDQTRSLDLYGPGVHQISAQAQKKVAELKKALIVNAAPRFDDFGLRGEPISGPVRRTPFSAEIQPPPTRIETTVIVPTIISREEAQKKIRHLKNILATYADKHALPSPTVTPFPGIQYGFRKLEPNEEAAEERTRTELLALQRQFPDLTKSSIRRWAEKAGAALSRFANSAVESAEKSPYIISPDGRFTFQNISSTRFFQLLNDFKRRKNKITPVSTRHTTIQTKKAPPPGSYSQAVAVDLQKNIRVTLSGQTGNIPETDEVVPGGIEPQTRQALENLKAVLKAAGGSLKDVADVTITIKDMAANKAGLEKVYREYFQAPFPKRTLVEVSEIPLPTEDTIVMIDMEAYVPKPNIFAITFNFLKNPWNFTALAIGGILGTSPIYLPSLFAVFLVVGVASGAVRVKGRSKRIQEKAGRIIKLSIYTVLFTLLLRALVTILYAFSYPVESDPISQFQALLTSRPISQAGVGSPSLFGLLAIMAIAGLGVVGEILSWPFKKIRQILTHLGIYKNAERGTVVYWLIEVLAILGIIALAIFLWPHIQKAITSFFSLLAPHHAGAGSLLPISLGLMGPFRPNPELDALKRKLGRFGEQNLGSDPQWYPLELLVPRGLRHWFMLMGQTETNGTVIYSYKHTTTRRYLNVDAQGNVYRYSPTTETYALQPRPDTESTVRWAFGGVLPFDLTEYIRDASMARSGIYKNPERGSVELFDLIPPFFLIPLLTGIPLGVGVALVTHWWVSVLLFIAGFIISGRSILGGKGYILQYFTAQIGLISFFTGIGGICTEIIVKVIKLITP
ncbi:MAG: hypothetical protein HY399_05005 [Elusimicrobia bacterium]|nr:hypothetical protein [Elusimicrobiota bacterium]